MGAVEFSVPTVFGWQRAGYDRRSGRHFEREGTKRVKDEVRGEFIRACPEGTKFPLYGPHVPVVVTVGTHRPLPKSKPKRVLLEPDTVKPDIDNIAKLVLDALTGLAYADDAQVVEVHVTKWARGRNGGERTEVRVERGWEPKGRITTDGRG